MKKNHAVRGLIKYFFSYTSLVIKVVVGLLLIISIFAIMIGSTPKFSLASMYMVILIVFISPLENSSNKIWNKFCLTMPVSRRDVVKSEYLIALIMIMGVLVITGIVIGIARIAHTMEIAEYGRFAFAIDSILEHIEGIDPRIITTRMIFATIGAVLVSCGLFFPLSYTKFKEMREVFSFLSSVVVLLIGALFLWIGYRFEIPMGMLFVLTVAVPAILFFLSYLLTCRLYEKVDI